MFDKEIILTMLNDGHSIDEIGKAIADAMNAASAEYQEIQERKKKEAAEQQKQARKKELIAQFIDTLQEYGELCGLPAGALALSQHDLDTIEASLDAYTKMFVSMSKLTDDTNGSDDAVLSKFVQLW